MKTFHFTRAQKLHKSKKDRAHLGTSPCPKSQCSTLQLEAKEKQRKNKKCREGGGGTEAAG